MEKSDIKESENLKTMAHQYAVNLAMTINNGLESNILKMGTLTKLNSAALETYTKTYDSLTKGLEDSTYNDNKKYF